MPYSNVKDPEQVKKMDDCKQKVMAKGHSEASAIAICYTSVVGGQSAKDIAERFTLQPGVDLILQEFTGAAGERVAFEPFADFDTTKPIRIVPRGKWYRDNRVLDINDQRLDEMLRNFDAGLPRYGVPINVEHGGEASQAGAIGTIKRVNRQPDGIYATEYEFTDVGKKLLQEGRYRGVSPEIVWSLNNNAKYQDPTTGAWHDNVITGLALTNSAFFGSDVAVFAAMGGAMQGIQGGFPPGQPPGSQQNEMDPMGMAKQVMAWMKKLMTAMGGGEEQQPPQQPQPGQQPPFGQAHSQPAHIERFMSPEMRKMAEDAGMDADEIKALEAMTPEDQEKKLKEWKAKMSDRRGGESMGDTIDKEKFAELERKAAMVEELRVKLESAEKASARVAEQLAQETQLRRLGEFRKLAETFGDLPAKTEELGGHLLWLNDADATADKAHYSYLRTVLETLNAAMKQSEVFRTIATGRTPVDASKHPFETRVEKVRVERFGTKTYAEGYADAFRAVSDEDKELALDYAMSKRAR